MSSQKELIKQLLDNAVHVGHRRELWSPKMRHYLYGVQNGIHVFDLSQTAAQLEAARARLSELTQQGKSVLFVGTKLQAQTLVKDLAVATGHMYITSKWVPGMITNFSTIKKRIIAFNRLEKDIATGALEAMFTKQEISEKTKELEKLRDAYEGVRDIRRLPDLVVVIDGYYERLALVEARKMGIETMGLMGSTGDSDLCDSLVAMNVNTTKSIEFVLNYLKSSIHAPKKQEVQIERNVSRIRDDRRHGPRREESAPAETPAAA